MSTTDNRIVRMQFDNAQFEAGVTKSMQTLDKLNEKLQFKEAQKGVSALQVAVAGISGIGDGVINNALKGLDKIADYSTTVIGKIKDQIKNEIASAVTSAINTITSIPSKALSQIESGGWARASNLANAKFTVEGLGYDWDEMLKAVNYGVQDTAYGLDAAAKAASSLAASGVDFKESVAGANDSLMHTSLRAISGVAAMTNSTYDEIAHVFTRVAGQGKVMGQDLQSLATRGLNAAATLAKAFNTSEAEIRDAVSKGVISFDMFAKAMDEAYGEHAKEANKTFTGALSNMKAALSRIGAIFAQPVIDKTNTFFVSVTSRIKEFQKALSDTKGYNITEKGMEKIRKKAEATVKQMKGLSDKDYAAQLSNEINRLKNLSLGDQLKESLKAGDVEEYPIMRFAGHFAEMWQSGVDAASRIVEELDLHWFEDIANFLDNLAIKIKGFFDGVIGYYDGITTSIESVADKMRKTIGISLEDWHYINEVAIKGSYGYMQERWDKLDKDMNEEGGGKRIQGYVDQLAMAGYSYEKLGWTEDEVRKKQEELEKSFSEQIKTLSDTEVLYGTIAETGSALKTVFGMLGRDLKSAAEGFVNIGRAIGEISISAIRSFIDGMDFEAISETTQALWEAFKDLTAALIPTEQFLDGVGIAAGSAGAGLSALIQTAVKTATTIVQFAADLAHGRTSLQELMSSADLSPMERFSAKFIGVVTIIKNAAKNLFTSTKKIFGSFSKAITNVFKKSGAGQHIDQFADKVANLSNLFLISDDTAAKFQNAIETVLNVFKKLGTAVGNVTAKIAGLFSKKSGLGVLGKTSKDAASEIADMADEVLDISVDTEKAEGIFYRFKIILGNVVDTIKEAPGKIKAFFEEMKNNESVIHLKEAFENLKTTFKNTIDEVFPKTEKAFKLFGATGEDATESGESVSDKLIFIVEKIVEGITWVVEKMTWLVGQIPGWKDTIIDFFESIQAGAEVVFNFVTGKIDEFGKKFGIDELFSNISSKWEEASEDGTSILSGIKNFGTEIYDTVSGALGNIDWGKLGKVSMLGLLAANMFSTFKMFVAGEGLIQSVKKIPDTIGGLFKAVTGMVGSVQKSAEKLTNLYMFTTIVGAIVALAGVLVLLKDIPIEDLANGLSVLLILAGIMLVIAWAVSLLNKNTKTVEKAFNNEGNTAKVAGVQIMATLPKIFGIAAVIVATGAAFAMIVKALADAAEAFNHASPETIDALVSTVKGIAFALVAMMAVVGVIVFILGRVSEKTNEVKTVGKRVTETNKKTTKDSTELLNSFAGLAVAIIAIAGAVWLLVDAMVKLSEANVDPGSALTVIFSVVLILGLSMALVREAEHVQAKPLLALAAVLATVFLGMYLIISQIIILGTALDMASKLGGGEGFMIAMGAVMGILAVIFLTMGYMLKQMYVVDKGSVAALIPLLWSLVAGIVIIVAAVGILGSAWAGTDPASLELAVLAMAVCAVGIMELAKKLQEVVISINDKGIDIGTFAAIMGTIVGAILVVSIATAILANSFGTTGPEVGAGLLGIVMAFTLFAIMAQLIHHTLEAYSGVDLKQLIGVVAAIGGMILVLAVSVLIIGVAAALMANVPFVNIIGTLLIVGLMIGSIFLITKSLASSNLYPGELDALALSIFAIGGTMIMIAIAAMVFAKACEMMANSGADGWDVVKVLAPIILIFAVLAGIAALATKSGSGQKFVEMFAQLTGVFLTFAISLLLVGVAVGVIGKGLGTLAEGLAKLIPIVSEHWFIAIVIVAVLVVLCLVLTKVIDVAKPFIAMILSAGTTIINILGKVVSAFSKVFDFIGEKLGIGNKKNKKSLTSKLKEWWDKLQPKAKYAIATGVITIIGGLAAVAPEALEKISNIIFTVMKWLIKLVPKIIDFLVELLITIVNGLADTIRSKGARIAQAIFNLLESLAELLIHVAADVVIGLFDWIPGVQKAVESLSTLGITKMRHSMAGINSYTESMEKLNETVSDTELAMTSLNAAAELKGAKDKAGNALDGLIGGFGDSISKLTGTGSGFDFEKVLGGSSLADTVNNMNLSGDSVSGMDIANVMPFDIDTGDMTDMMGDGMTDALSNFDASSVQSGDMASMVESLTGGTQGDMYDMGYDYGGALGEGEAEGYTNAYAAETASADNIGQVQDATQELADASHETMASMENQVAAAKAVETGIKDPTIKALIGGRGPLYEESKYYGSAVTMGMLAAFNDPETKQRFKESMLGLANTQFTTYTSAKGIDANSPSKRFYQAGLWCVLGIADGIRENEQQASDSMLGLSDQMIAAFGNPLEYAARMASGEIEYDPSIRPILDTSMVGVGANSINSMFDNQNVSLSGLAGTIAYDMTNLNGSNAAVVAEIQGLREDMDYMTQQMTNMQIVMDTGALVGATAGAMDKDLGMRKLYSERGDI